MGVPAQIPSSVTDDQPIDLAIIGGGPAGLFAAFYAGLRKMRVRIIDSLEILGGQLTTLYPEKDIYDVPGFPKVLAKVLADRLIRQAMQYQPEVALGEQVQTIHFDEASRLYHLVTSTRTHFSRAMVIAAGVGAFHAKTLPLSNAASYEGRGLHYFVKRCETFRGKKVLIVGGGDMAVDWANLLAPIARQVTLIHRHDHLHAHEDSITRMRQTNVRFRPFHQLLGIGGHGRIEYADVYGNRTMADERLPVDDLVVNLGFVNTLGPFRQWGLELEGNAIKVDGRMQTSRPGIFAAGDICTYPGKLKLIATAFGEAAIAVNHAKHFLDPSANLFPGHSTNLKPSPVETSTSDAPSA